MGKKEHPCDQFLVKSRIRPVFPRKGMTVQELVENFNNSGAFNGGRLGQACRLYEKMINENCTIAWTLSGAMTPTGFGGTLIELMKAGFIDMIISTGANLYHDLHFALDLPVHQGDFRVDDNMLWKSNLSRIYDIFISDELLLSTDDYIIKTLDRSGIEGNVPTSKLHQVLGAGLWDTAPHPEISVVAWAEKLGIPVFCPSPGDSSIGMNMASMKLKGGTLTIDSDMDVLDLTAVIQYSDMNAVVIVGGGAPKNFYLQTQPTLWQIFQLNEGGHDYFIQMTSDAPHWGGLSGATPNEAISWGKVKADEVDNHVVVYSDATIAAPILAANALDRCEPRPQRNLLDRLPELVERLRKDVDKGILS
ncbi:deoxyhypusine synthase [Thermodesulfobacteriota bacterium]